MVSHEHEHATSLADREDAIFSGEVNLTSGDAADFPPDEDIDMAALLDESMSSIESGQIITGTVLKVTSDDVVVDIGSKSEGLVPLREFLDDGKDLNVFVGMEVEVMVVKQEGSDGLPILSRKRAKQLKARRALRDAHKNGEPVKATVVTAVKGGMQVDVDGLRGFIPFSQLGPGARTADEQKALTGRQIDCKILEMKSKNDLVLSHRAVFDERRETMRDETLQNLAEGKLVKGIVKNMTDFGAFIDLGGVDGLLHVKDISWGHVGHPSEVLHVADEIEVVVLSIEGERIGLGMKQKTADPWLSVAEKYPVGGTIGGKVTSLTKYGAFVELEEGVEGLIHISEMSWTKRVRHPSEMMKEGEEVGVKVLGIDMERKRISLSLRQTEVDPWTLARNNYPAGTIIEGEVTGMTDFGAFVRLPEGVDGMIHVSDLSWAGKVTHPKQVVKKGEVVRCKVLEIDPSQQRISLGLKQLEQDPWEAAQQKYRPGTSLPVVVKRLTDFGAFVELEEGIEGLVHHTQVGQKGQRPEDLLRVGDTVVMKVLKFDRSNRKISLSLKEYVREQEEKEVKQYMAESAGGNATLGELLGEQMRALMEKQQQDSPGESQE
ncbi:MAG: 30S ribosomal protein S1 [bacterium]|nr:30S ribosomal protein S1 [bacterium]